MSRAYQVPFGDGFLDFTIPDDWPVDVVQAATDIPPLTKAEIESRLLAFAERLKATIDRTRPLIFVFTDATRASPDQALLEPVIRHLADDNFDITLMCAVGMHRPSTRQEKINKLGEWLVDSFPVIDHDPADVIEYGVVSGVPVEANRRLKNATLVSVGVVEPHQYAGYSGGAKTVVIGCGGSRTIGATHGPAFLDQPGTRVAHIEGNPFQQFVRQGGSLIGHDWAVNVLLNSSGKMLDLATGMPDAVHDTLSDHARAICETVVPNAPYDVVIAGVGAPKDVNLYQASRAATYVGLSAHPVIRRGGVIIVPAPLPEGGGQGEGERAFLTAMLRFGATRELISHLRETGCRPGEQRAYMVAQLRQHFRLMMVGAQNPIPVLEAGLDFAPDMQTALQAATRMTRLPNPRTLVIPHALQTLPISLA